ncbi:FemAB family XrtA/PEP-CTERM system-associated protein [Tautonia plasticadhaerens]|uniref:FemAB family protein n=1 Tax=Tautonia plasticadhaerens TaxID=2527974 RepID=A0A518HFW5_9BACT|nr:FemAB family XrtA/PEP-CTERM system-associated protein [Tautonia plasticadhaerens]QDV39720.1 FemAB family protein [Tautonia plasticadhaerens]
MIISPGRPGKTRVLMHAGECPDVLMARWEAFVAERGPGPLSYHPAWPSVLARGLGHTPFWIEVAEGDRTRGLLPLCFLRTRLFGRFLVGLPYLNYGGALAEDETVARLLVDEAVALADRLEVRFLELRQEHVLDHPALAHRPAEKAYMRLALPGDPETLWTSLSSKVRNQIRKGQKSGLEVTWGGEDQLDAFYEVFCRNMRDLGTPVFGRRLFREAARRFPGLAEFCVVRAGRRPVAAAMLLHGRGVTEVPSAGALREFNHQCANMIMYHNLLERAVAAGQETFDFGRSTPDTPVYRFKKQWGAVPAPAGWRSYVRVGAASELRPDNPRYRHAIRAWQRLPVALTRWVGPAIVRGIP